MKPFEALKCLPYPVGDVSGDPYVAFAIFSFKKFAALQDVKHLWSATQTLQRSTDQRPTIDQTLRSVVEDWRRKYAVIFDWNLDVDAFTSGAISPDEASRRIFGHLKEADYRDTLFNQTMMRPMLTTPAV